jgi:hypothetical protein
MKHSVLLIVNALENFAVSKRAGIAWLSAARWIKRRAVESHCGPAANALGFVDDSRVKLDQMRIVVIEAFCNGHRSLDLGLWS